MFYGDVYLLYQSDDDGKQKSIPSLITVLFYD